MNPRFAPAAVVIALAMAGTLVSGVGAQSSSYRVEFVTGSCAEPGGVVAAVAEPAWDGDIVDAPAEMEAVAAALGPEVRRAHAALPAVLADIVATEHAVLVYERGRPPGRRVACGEIGPSDGSIEDVQLGLAGSGDPGLAGVVWLRDNGDGATDAWVAISAHAAPAIAAGDDGRIEVAIRRSLYLPNPLEVEAGTTVTWINEDALPHTTTATDFAFDSGYMPLEARYSYTFETPGEYPIFCLYHPRMRAVVIVR